MTYPFTVSVDASVRYKLNVKTIANNLEEAKEKAIKEVERQFALEDLEMWSKEWSPDLEYVGVEEVESDMEKALLDRQDPLE